MRVLTELEIAVVDAALVRHDVIKMDVFAKTPVADAKLYAACEALRKEDQSDLRIAEAFQGVYEKR